MLQGLTRQSRRAGLALAGVGLATLSACGGDAAAAPSARDLELAFGYPRLTATGAYFSRSLLVESLYSAAALTGAAWTGNIPTTGTLTAGLLGAQYAPEPTDRLVVMQGDIAHEFVVHEIQGNNSQATAAGWLMSPHKMRYSHRMPGESEGEISVHYDGARFDVTVQGWAKQSGRRLEVDLHGEGLVNGTLDLHGQDTKTGMRLTGTVKGEGLSIDVNELHDSHLVAATSVRILPSWRGSASRSNGTLNNKLRSGGAEYALVDVKITTDVGGRGGQGNAGVRALSGSVTRNGDEFGQCVLIGGRPHVQTANEALPLDGLPGGG